MANWFEGKVVYPTIDDDGREVKKTDMYLLDALSYTEAEARLAKEMEPVIKGDYQVSGLKKSNITELVPSDNELDGRWYKVKVSTVCTDDVSGKDKVSFQYYLVAAGRLHRALSNVMRNLAPNEMCYEICSVTDTLFVDVFPYEAPEEV